MSPTLFGVLVVVALVVFTIYRTAIVCRSRTPT
jgi:hypothetical protein